MNMKNISEEIYSAKDKSKQLKLMMKAVSDINEMEFRDEKVVRPKAMALAKGILIGADIPEVTGLGFAELAKIFFKTVKAEIGVFTSEAWYADEPVNERPTPDDPGSIEIVIVVGGYNGRYMSKASKIIRRSEEVTYLEEYCDHEMEEYIISDCFVGVFDDDPVGDPIGEA